ncbi:TonB-dependent receptor [Sphingosinicella rhizophila]|uniref:TonB-dependent receptor n=1 Tax=Sphingosinicella rhizophila TaxID=3050082 RepID=A0ABU3Q5Z5_9SPHN|nr:TonB-dependent receptor [Sphingosinicella sp. GR2756]MDT9598833.1 TonB-dependent receptor [Sphingosinicella sp. GR2756]
MAQTEPVEAQAEQAGPRDSNDIIVTASRREESALDVPISIVAYSQEKLDQKGVRNIEDLVRYTPGVTLTQGFSNIKYIAIRGLQSSVGATMTGLYIDDTPVHIRNLVLMNNFYPALYDLERVEVLRGPQGTLFGASAMGGAIRFITAKPNLTEFVGNARAELAFTEHGDPSYEAGAAIGGPLIQDKLGFRINANYRRDGGYIDRVPYRPGRGTAEENSNSARTFVANASLMFKPIDTLTITPSVFYQKALKDDSSTYWTFKEGSTRPQPPLFQSGQGVASTGRDRTILAQNKIEWDVGPVSLISNTAYINRKIRSSDDGTAFLLDVLGPGFAPFYNPLLPFAGGSGPLDIDLTLPGNANNPNCGECVTIELDMVQKGFTQEFRVQSNDPDARLRYVVGAFYQKTRQASHEFDTARNALGGALYLPADLLIAAYGPVLGPLLTLPVGANGNWADSFSRIVDKQYALFGQVDFELFENLTLTAGLRYSVLEFESQQIDTDVVTGTPSISPIRRSKEKPLTPKFGIQYDFSDDFMVYATAAKGFRSGGVNTSSEVDPTNYTPACLAGLELLGLTEIPATYTSDSTWSYEVGAKGRIGRTLSVAADVFYTEWTDVQRSRSVPAGCLSVFTDNFGKARSQGIEAQVTFTPVAGLTLDANLAYIDATQRETIYVFGTTNTITRKGDRFATPWTINLTADYETPIGWDDARVYGTVQYTYRSEWNAKPGNVGFNPLTLNTDSQNQVNARLGIRRDGFDISAFVNNLTNSRDIIGRLNFQPADRVEIQTWRPRTFGLTGRYNF